MNIPIEDLHFRPIETKDINSVFDLIIDCERAEYGEHDASMEDLIHDLETTNPELDSWLAFTPGNELVGYRLLMPWFSNLRYDFFVHPEWSDSNLGIALLNRCDRRARAKILSINLEDGLVAVCYIAHVNNRDRISVEACGFELAKHHFQMQIDLLDLIPEPRWPEGIGIRNTIPNEDDKSVHQLIETAFARPGRTPSRFEDWQNAMMRGDIFDPTLWFLAFFEDELVGACLCYEYPEKGWVRQLGVMPEWRGKGLGSALLRQAFHVLQERNFTAVGLTVDSQNENAYQFYQRLGMQRVRQFAQYEKTLIAP